jgi:RNA polymerase sigma-70 factor (ECF subfamily)
MDEREAIQRLKRGDLEGLGELVRCHQLSAVRAAYLVVRDRALAEDVVQAAFVRTYERIAGFDQQRPFAPWFLRMVLNDAIKAATRHAQEARLTPSESGPVDPQAGPERRWEQAETADEVWAALGQLSPTHRAAIVQRYYLGLSQAEMADTLGCPASTIKSRLHAARERLRELLQPIRHDLETSL